MKKLMIILFIFIGIITLIGCEGNIKNTHVIGFYANGGTPVRPLLVTLHDEIEEPKAPTRSGFIFEGWYMDKALTLKVMWPHEVVRTQDFYAKWRKAI